MAQARWKKYEKINSRIMSILRAEKRHMTTNEVAVKLDLRYNLNLNWHTLNNYLAELAKVGHIKSIELKKGKNVVHNWTIRGVEDGVREEGKAGSVSA